MNKLLNIKKILLLLLIVITISACGYRPSAKFSRDAIGEKISTSVIISAEDPENTVIIKDAVDRAIIEVFQTSLVSKDKSDTHLVLSMSTPLYTPIVYDENGYIIGYRMSVSLTIKSYKNGVSKTYQTRGNHDFSVVANTLVTDQQRFEAIGFSTQRAIRSFLAQVSADGAKSKK